jgi:Dolichyl-phosphate-mannose-protein mannosyltransferase
MPKLPQFALADLRPLTPKPQHAIQLLIFFLLFGLPYFAAHIPLLGLPYFWDEHGQFIPTALDLLRDHAWVAHSTVPNIHPPAVEAYLALCYAIFGYSIVATRVAMLVLAAFGALGMFMLSVELCRGAKGAPAFFPVILLLASPLFFMQSMMAQLDMPAMVFTVWALYFFVKNNYVASAASCVILVLSKDTGLIVPLIFVAILARRALRPHRKSKRALVTAPPPDPGKSLPLFLLAPAALALWLVVLHNATGHWTGNPDFARYNVTYSLHPVRIALSLARRFFYIFIAEFRWIGSLALLMAGPRLKLLLSRPWRVALCVFGANFLLMSLLGGAALERYLLPILPIFYIAVTIALTTYPRWVELLAISAMAAGLIFSLFWNPPYPFPFENNLAMVDFVRLQESAAAYAERNLPASRIATAWPYTAGLARQEFGFVERPLQVVETNDLHQRSIAAIPPQSFDVLITYTRTWAPAGGVIANPLVRRFLSKFYDYAPEITEEECAALGLTPMISWSRRGQTITIFRRMGSPQSAPAWHPPVQ